ncbi:MAG: DNA phosphorothioation-associated putative methyltransferase, partial [Aeromonadaceae bacterium]
WDPNFRPEGDKVASALVNLGYVINVIEDRDERIEALLGAWALADTLLVVSAMLGSEDFIAQFKPYKDGIITSRNTFQKYFNQSELRGFIERTLDEQPIAIAPGIFFVFKDKLEEQRFLAGCQKRHHGWQQLNTPSISQEEKKRALLESHQELFNAFWQQCLGLGRVPANEEFARSDELRALSGSHRQALLLLTETENEQSQLLAQARADHIEDLLVYFALNLFDKRKPYTQLPDELKRDIKAFFGDYRTLQQRAVALLYAISSPQQIAAACQLAHQQLPASLLFADHALLLHKRYISELPALLRVYVGAASQLYGELDEIDVVKIHIQSGKVSLMGYNDFEQPIPYLRERVKIKMAEQDVDFFDYVDEQRRPPLLNKSYLLPAEHPDFAKQRSLEQRLGALLGVDLSQDLNLSRIEFEAGLKQAEVRIGGFRLYRR